MACFSLDSVRLLSCDTVPLLYLSQLCQIDGAVELALEQGVEAVLGTQQALLLNSIIHSSQRLNIELDV